MEQEYYARAMNVVLKEINQPTIDKGTMSYYRELNKERSPYDIDITLLCDYVRLLNKENKSRYKDLILESNSVLPAIDQLSMELGTITKKYRCLNYLPETMKGVHKYDINFIGLSTLVSVAAFCYNHPNRIMNPIYALPPIFNTRLIFGGCGSYARYHDVDLALPLIENIPHFLRMSNGEYPRSKITAIQMFIKHHLPQLDEDTQVVLSTIPINTWQAFDARNKSDRVFISHLFTL